MLKSKYIVFALFGGKLTTLDCKVKGHYHIITHDEDEALRISKEYNSWVDKNMAFIVETKEEYHPPEKNSHCECGEKLKPFMHNCSQSEHIFEIEGCPKCDDVCGFCKGE